MSIVKNAVETTVKTLKKGRGRPKKIRTPEELKKLELKKKTKLTLIQKQNIKLKKQKEREAKKLRENTSEQANKEKFYCTNKDLQRELLRWRNSSSNGLKVYKLVGENLVLTQTFDTPEIHEPYVEGTRYFIKYPKTHKRYQFKSKNGYKFFKETNDEVVEDVTELVENQGWAFDIDDPNDRKMSNELGTMMIHMADKILNHSNFRNYKQELKEDAKSFFYLKVIKGLKNYNFKFNNPFAYFSQCAFNSYLTIITQNYKHQNTKKEVMKQIYTAMQTYRGIDPRSTLSRYIKEYIDDGTNCLEKPEDDENV